MIEITSNNSDCYEIRISKQTLRTYADGDYNGSVVQYHIDEYVEHIRRFLRTEIKNYLTYPQYNMEKKKKVRYTEKKPLLKSRYDLIKEETRRKKQEK
jgi:hypothetical protein